MMVHISSISPVTLAQTQPCIIQMGRIELLIERSIKRNHLESLKISHFQNYLQRNQPESRDIILQTKNKNVHVSSVRNLIGANCDLSGSATSTSCKLLSPKLTQQFI